MPKTKKNVKTSKTKDLEDLLKKEDLDLSDTDSVSDTDTDLGSESNDDDETSMSKELNKKMNETIDDLKACDLTMPTIGIGLLAIIGFALYKGINA